MFLIHDAKIHPACPKSQDTLYYLTFFKQLFVTAITQPWRIGILHSLAGLAVW